MGRNPGSPETVPGILVGEGGATVTPGCFSRKRHFPVVTHSLVIGAQGNVFLIESAVSF